MIDIRTLLFVISDGGRARLVRRAPDGAGFTTIEEMDNGETLKALKAERAANPATRVFDRVGSGRHGAGKDSSDRLAKEGFVVDVADRAVALVREHGLAGVYVAASTTLIAPLHDRLAASVTVFGTIGKDLTKVPDPDLGAWLDDARYAPSSPG
tara:strand:- start:1520 stop:1981 length:462 start_codon:yes stop_codon:yes gene_type:complete